VGEFEHAIHALPCGQDQHRGNPLEMATGQNINWKKEKKKHQV
jgi:hypothetical protein